MAWDSSRRDDGAGQLVAVSGELDLATVPGLERALGAASGQIVLDCRGLSFKDALGLVCSSGRSAMLTASGLST